MSEHNTIATTSKNMHFKFDFKCTHTNCMYHGILYIMYQSFQNLKITKFLLKIVYVEFWIRYNTMWSGVTDGITVWTGVQLSFFDSSSTRVWLTRYAEKSISSWKRARGWLDENLDSRWISAVNLQASRSVNLFALRSKIYKTRCSDFMELQQRIVNEISCSFMHVCHFREH